MTTRETIDAAVAAMNRVSDRETLETTFADYIKFRENCPYFEFVERSTVDSFPFRSDTAHVVTRKEESKSNLSDSKANVVRTITRSGELPLILPTVRVEVTKTWKYPSFPGPLRDRIMGEIETELGPTFATLARQHICLALLASAERSDRVLKVDIDEVPKAVTDAIRQASGGGNATVLSHTPEILQLHTENLPNFAQVLEERALHPAVVLVVPSKPRLVGFARIKEPPALYVQHQNVDELVATAVAYMGFCVWGHAEVFKIDCREDAAD